VQENRLDKGVVRELLEKLDLLALPDIPPATFVRVVHNVNVNTRRAYAQVFDKADVELPGDGARLELATVKYYFRNARFIELHLVCKRGDEEHPLKLEVFEVVVPGGRVATYVNIPYKQQLAPFKECLKVVPG